MYNTKKSKLILKQNLGKGKRFKHEKHGEAELVAKLNEDSWMITAGGLFFQFNFMTDWPFVYIFFFF